MLTLPSGKHWLFPLRISHNKVLEDNHKPLSTRLPGTGLSLMRSLTHGDIAGLPDIITEEGIIFPSSLRIGSTGCTEADTLWAWDVGEDCNRH